MYVTAKLPKEHFLCSMCSFQGYKDRYVIKTFHVDERSPSKELITCKNCALREHGSKNRIKLNNIIEERTKEWQKNRLKKEL